VSGTWVTPARRRQSQFGPTRFCFLNRDGDLVDGGWDDPNADKLWLYNLHYFDDLSAAGSESRSDWHRALIARWIADNPPAEGTGWEPYPTSLRVVNWIKWVLSGHSLPDSAGQSLAVQARWLSRRLEYHLLGNHLFANAKALVFAGLFFEGSEAQSWLDLGLGILADEIDKQILADGGHFELSPMYHALALEDALDLLNSARAYPAAFPEAGDGPIDKIERRLPEIRRWLATMCHPDGEIAFFNDAAIGVAPPPAELEDYANRLGVPEALDAGEALTSLAESGYIRLSAGPAVAILDVARVGPDYLPGHAHADSLSFELTIRSRRVLVNSGTSVYGAGPERQRQRGTRAHNTVVIDDADSSEVWAGFRVGRRAHPFDLKQQADENELCVECSHDGYKRLPGRPVHRRRWRMKEDALSINDTVTGGACATEACFHFHPDVVVTLDTFGATGVAQARGLAPIRLEIEPAGGRLEPSSWHPEFGVTRSSQCLVVPLEGGRSEVTLRWDEQ
jgi:uncharacterized heparinase superfamily protein